MSKNNVSDSLREFGLNDDQILEIACTQTLGDSSKLLKEYMYNKWGLSTLEAMQIVKKLKEELKQ